VYNIVNRKPDGYMNIHGNESIPNYRAPKKENAGRKKAHSSLFTGVDTMAHIPAPLCNNP
jgi:hypothetical protein